MRTKANIVDSIFIAQGAEGTLSKKEIASVVDSMLEVIRYEVANGRSIQIRGFCTMLPVERKQKKVHDFLNRKTVTMPKRKGVKIRVSKDFEEFVNNYDSENV